MYYHFLILSLHISFFLIIGGEMLSLSRFNPKLHRHTHLFICDVQEVFSPLVYRSATVINNIALLNNVANILKIPVIVTEQYPKAFGRTVKVSLEVILLQLSSFLFYFDTLIAALSCMIDSTILCLIIYRCIYMFSVIHLIIRTT